MTQSAFNALPLNLKPAQVKAVLGVSDQALQTLRELHPEIVVRQCGRGAHIYSKAEIAKLAKLKFE